MEKIIDIGFKGTIEVKLCQIHVCESKTAWLHKLCQ